MPPIDPPALACRSIPVAIDGLALKRDGPALDLSEVFVDK
jgi:hypothetical protein